jgi:hypothetical protein
MVAKVKEDAETSTDIEVAAHPQIATVKEMPRPRRGRRGIDTSYLEELLQEGKPHAFENVEDRNQRERYARQVRAAAKKIGLEASTTYVEEEQRLYFQGFANGEAPARGRRSAATRKA